MGSALDALEVLDMKGERLAKLAFQSAYYFGLTSSAAGKTHANGWACGLYSTDGKFMSVDLLTAKPRWTLDLGVPPQGQVSIAAGDIDGDGFDNFVVGLSDGRVVAIAERDGKGVVLWHADLGVPVIEVVIADVDGDGFAELVVVTDDGVIHILAAR